MIDFVLNHFDELATLPGAVPKLRSFILDQAVRGNLTADWRQDHPDVEPASVLLERIREEKKELVKAGKIKKQKELPPVEPDKIPFEVPESWEWTRLGDLTLRVTDGTHVTPQYTSNGVPFLSVKDISKGNINLEDSRRVAHETAKALRKSCDPAPGDVLLTKVGTTGIAVPVETSEEFALFVSVALLKLPTTGISSRYLSMEINSPFLRRITREMTEGVGNKNLVLRKIRILPISVPAVDEQLVIVRRIDQLMTVCDQLEVAQSRSENARRNALASGALHLTDDTSDVPFTKRWQRFSDRLPELVRSPDHTKRVQDAILQLAVRGHLTADWRAENPDVEPASVLLERIRAEKKELEKAGEIKKQKELPPVGPDKVPFEVPESWEWVRLGSAYDVRDGTHETPKYMDNGIPFVTSKNLSDDGLDLTNTRRISPELHAKFSKRSNVVRGDVLMAMIGTIGNPVVVNTDVVFSIKNVALFKMLVRFKGGSNFLHRILQAQEGRLKRDSAGGVQSFVSLRFLRYFPVPFPPDEEQAEIVTRTDELMALAERLRKAAEDRHKQAETLLATLENR